MSCTNGEKVERENRKKDSWITYIDAKTKQNYHKETVTKFS